MTILQEVFTAKSPLESRIVVYPHNTSFKLESEVAFILEGTVGVDEAVVEGEGNYRTVRLVKSKSYLNLESVLFPEDSFDRLFVVESQRTVLTVIKTSYLKSLLDLGDDVNRISLYREVTKALAIQAIDTTETAVMLSGCDSENKVSWALQRLGGHLHEDQKMSWARMMSHTGLSKASIFRSLRSLREKRTLPAYAERLLHGKSKWKQD